MSFASSWVWILVLVFIPLAVFFYVYVFRKRQSVKDRLGGFPSVQDLLRKVDDTRYFLKMILLFLAILTVFLALTRPQMGEKEVQAKKEGVDIVVAIDTSLSMMAEDVKPSRLKKAKREISRLISVMKGDRLALIAFSGEAFLQCPLTTDRMMSQLLLESIDSSTVSAKGTSLSEAIKVARESFLEGEDKYKVIILITDGEDHEGLVLKEARVCADRGIRIYTIGLGERDGVPIPILDASSGSVVGYKKDSSGRVILSRVDEKLLQSIAQVTKGAYIHGNQMSWNLGGIYKAISHLEKKELDKKLVVVLEDRYQYILWIVFVLLFIEFILSVRKGVPLWSFFSSLLKKSCLAFFVISSLGFSWPWDRKEKKAYAFLQKRDYKKARKIYEDLRKSNSDEKRYDYNLSLLFYKEGLYDRALERAIVAEKNDLFRKNMHFHKGNIFYRKGAWQEAQKQYRCALDIDPEFYEAKHNFEFIEKLIELQRKNAKDKDPSQKSEKTTPKDQGQQGQQMQMSNKAKTDQKDPQSSCVTNERQKTTQNKKDNSSQKKQLLEEAKNSQDKKEKENSGLAMGNKKDAEKKEKEKKKENSGLAMGNKKDAEKKEKEKKDSEDLVSQMEKNNKMHAMPSGSQTEKFKSTQSFFSKGEANNFLERFLAKDRWYFSLVKGKQNTGRKNKNDW